MRKIINIYRLFNTSEGHKVRYPGITEKIKTLRKTPHCYVHIIIGLREDVNSCREVPVILKPKYDVLRHSLKLAVIKLNGCLVDDNTTVMNVIYTQI